MDLFFTAFRNELLFILLLLNYIPSNNHHCINTLRIIKAELTFIVLIKVTASSSSKHTRLVNINNVYTTPQENLHNY